MTTENTATSLTVHELCAGLFVRGLTNLKNVLRKGEAHAATSGIEPATLIDAKLATDMNNLAVQVFWAAEGSKLAIARLLGVPHTLAPNDAKSFAELEQSVDGAITQLRALTPDAFAATLERTIEIEHRGGSRKFTGREFLIDFAIPNFYFHVTTAYAILRSQGVQLTKADFMGAWG